MSLIIATCQNVPHWEKDDRPFHAALEELGIPFEIKAWDEPSFLNDDTKAVLIRTTWDYQEKPEAYMKWAQDTAQRVPLLNGPSVVTWNAKKTYLRDLHEAGAPLAPTIWLQKGDAVNVKQVLQKNDWTQGFIKPVFGATARGTCRFGEGLSNLDEAQAHLDQWLANEDMMIQPYLKSVETEGEISLLYMGGEFSHAVQKIPVPGDYKVQDDFDAKDFPIEASAELHELSETILETAKSCIQKRFGETPFFHYARVDLMKASDGQYVVGELELIEPSLFMRHDPQAGMRLARHVQSILKK